jgi:hypothetical protein
MASAHPGAGAPGGLDTRAEGPDTGTTPAQWYGVLAGAALVLAGILGFIADATFEVGDDLQRDEFIGFDVNGWHNIVHLASGAVLLVAAFRPAPARAVALAFGLVYGVVAIIGLIDGDDILGVLPINAADNVLHLALAGIGILAAVASPTGTGGAGPEREGRFTRRQGAHQDYDTLTGRPRGDVSNPAP